MDVVTCEGCQPIRHEKGVDLHSWYKYCCDINRCVWTNGSVGALVDYWNRKSFMISRNTHDRSSSWSWKVEMSTILPYIYWMSPSLVFSRRRKESCMEYMELLRWAYNLRSSISLLPLKLEDITNHTESIEKFAVLLYDRTCTISKVNDYGKDVFARKGPLLEGITPTSDALMQHLKRALYQASYCWGQSLIANQELHDPCL